MTCIAAAVDPTTGTIYMGGDAVSLQGGCVRIDRRSKVFRVGPFLVGASGSQRVSQILQHTFEPPAISGDLTRYMVRDLVPALRKHMSEQGGEVKNDSDQMQMDGKLIAGIDGQIFEVDQAYAVVHPRAPYYAIGSASQEAMAAKFVANDFLKSAEEIVLRGLLAAAEFDINIRPPFTILNLPKGNNE